MFLKEKEEGQIEFIKAVIADHNYYCSDKDKIELTENEVSDITGEIINRLTKRRNFKEDFGSILKSE